MFLRRDKAQMVTPEQALPGRPTRPFSVPAKHFVLGTPLEPPFPEGLEMAVFGMGCFWGAERKFWEAQPGVYTTAVGYAGGYTPNPTYEEVCSGRTGHTEVVLVVFDPNQTSYEDILRPPPSSSTPRTTTSSISPRIQAGIAGSAAPACRAPWAPA
jgi:peptide-methionine (S)-S-oxide reductase